MPIKQYQWTVKPLLKLLRNYAPVLSSIWVGRYVPMKGFMKSLAGIILIFFTYSSLAGREISAVEQKQRKLVSRFYGVLEFLPNRCPESSKKITCNLW